MTNKKYGTKIKIVQVKKWWNFQIIFQENILFKKSNLIKITKIGFWKWKVKLFNKLKIETLAFDDQVYAGRKI